MMRQIEICLNPVLNFNITPKTDVLSWMDGMDESPGEVNYRAPYGVNNNMTHWNRNSKSM